MPGPQPLLDRVALVTGAARGIGQACAYELGAWGARLALVDLAASVPGVEYAGATTTDLEQTALRIREGGSEALTFRCDVRDGDGLREVAARSHEHFGRIDYLVAAAGIDAWGDAWTIPDEVWRTVIDVNLTGAWLSAKAVVPYMLEQKGGAIVFIGSVNAHRPIAGFSHYVASKHGVLGLTRELALELAPHMIRVNSVDPTSVATDMLTNPAFVEQRAGSGSSLDDLARKNLDWNAMPFPWIEPVDVARAVAFLVSDNARYVTGVSLPVDLGALLK